MKKTITLITLLIFIGSFSFAQQNDSTKYNPYSGSQQKKKSAAEKVYFGGNLFLTFGSYTSVGIWPMVGYKATSKLSFGVQPGYEYLKYNSYGGEYETSNYGVRIFTRYRVIPQAYVHVEYANINYGNQYINAIGDVEEERNWVPFLYLGAGLSQHIGGSTYGYIQVLYDVLQSDKSPYASNELFWSVGVVAGF